MQSTDVVTVRTGIECWYTGSRGPELRNNVQINASKHVVKKHDWSQSHSFISMTFSGNRYASGLYLAPRLQSLLK